jgi:uncharacterized protein (TIGR03083 family)
VSTSTSATTDDFAAWSAAVHSSHDRLAAAAADLSTEQLEGPSYASDWSIAQVMSHLGSGAEIFTLFLEAGRDGADAPAQDVFQTIWARWDASTADEQRDGYLRANAKFLDELDALDDDQRAAWKLVMFNGADDLTNLVRLRAGEQAVHAWDVLVALDPAATLPQDATDLLIDTLPGLAGGVGKPNGVPLKARIATSHPERHFLLRADSDGVVLDADHAAGHALPGPVVDLPAEALIRLVYGRLDEAHTPALRHPTPELTSLRTLFPGF